MNNNQIKAVILADSISSNGNRVTTFELMLPRFVWAEVLTHSALARNAASSRAIPVSKSAAMIKANPAQPSMWGSNEPGMQSFTALTGLRLWLAKRTWGLAAWVAASFSETLAKIGLHKQYANRTSEYAQVYKAVLTATELDNFFHLRCHKDAQPEIKELACKMRLAMVGSTPNLLHKDEYHLPYITTKRNNAGELQYFNSTKLQLSTEQAKQISASCCAQVSYRLLDESTTKAEFIYDKLVNATPIHASPFEHQATPIPSGSTLQTDGVTHMMKDGSLCSGKFKGWLQARHFIPGNTCTNYTPHK